MTMCTGIRYKRRRFLGYLGSESPEPCKELPTSHVQWAQVHATQFHPEKSGAAGLDILRAFLDASEADLAPEPALPPSNGAGHLCSEICAG